MKLPHWITTEVATPDRGGMIFALSADGYTVSYRLPPDVVRQSALTGADPHAKEPASTYRWHAIAALAAATGRKWS